jgi:hypothetical protein
MDTILALGWVAVLVLMGALTIVPRAYFNYGSALLQGMKIDGGAISEPQSPSLLTIPSELRNEIYRLALTSSERIEITENYTEPALLSTCRQIRNEATPILYLENNWSINLHGWDCTLYKAFSTHIYRRGITKLSKLNVM